MKTGKMKMSKFNAIELPEYFIRVLTVLIAPVISLILYYRKVIFTNQNQKIHDHTNDTHQKVKVIEVPEELRRLYESQTGLEVQSTYFREPGAHVDTSNTVREFAGKLLSKDSGLESVIFHFDFDKQHYASYLGEMKIYNFI